jgi:hypothetical protein
VVIKYEEVNFFGVIFSAGEGSRSLYCIFLGGAYSILLQFVDQTSYKAR